MTASETFDFDKIINRQGTGSAKWSVFPEDVLPMWVADMDFESPPAVKAALHDAVEHGIFGYMFPPQELPRLLAERNQRLYGWALDPAHINYDYRGAGRYSVVV